MRFVVATLPDVKFNLGRDLSLVKTCALYGDETILFSPTYEGTEPFLDFSKRPLMHQLIYLAVWARDPGFSVSENLTQSEREARIKQATERSDGLLSKAKLAMQVMIESKTSEEARTELDKISKDIASPVRGIERIFGDDKDIVKRARQLNRAEQMGLVKIEQIHDVPSTFYDPYQLQADVGFELSRPDSFGALDERFVADFRYLSDGPTRKLRAARVAADILAKLPGFSAATFEEIRDIRKELEPYVANFRKSILNLSGRIRSTPWDDDFPHEVQRELYVALYPAIQEIEAQVRENSYLKGIILRAGRHPLAIPATSALGLVLSNATQASELISEIAGGLAGAALLAFEARDSWRQKRKQIETNEFFFYYQAAKLLSTKDKERAG